MDRREVGAAAERAVAQWFEQRGFVVIARNVRLQRGELDMIVRGRGTLWFVESKCRTRADVGPPHRAVDRRKVAALWAAAREYLYRTRHTGSFGFLVASVIWDPRGASPIIAVVRWPFSPPNRCRR